VAAGPAIALRPELLGGDDRLLVVDRREVVPDALAGQEHPKGEVGVLGHRVRVPAAEGAQRAHPDGAVRAPVGGQLEHRLAPVLVDQVAGQEVDEHGGGHGGLGAVADHAPAHDRAHRGVAEVPDEATQGRGIGLVVGVEDDDDRGVDEGERVVERAGLPTAGSRCPVQHLQARVPFRPRVEPGAGAVVRPVVDDDQGQLVPRVVQGEQRRHHAVDDEFLVLAADEHGQRRRPAVEVHIGGEQVPLGPARRGDREGQVTAEVRREQQIEDTGQHTQRPVDPEEADRAAEGQAVGEEEPSSGFRAVGVRSVARSSSRGIRERGRLGVGHDSPCCSRTSARQEGPPHLT
jgi:hypothetical protein